MDHLSINSRSTTENTLAQEQQRRCIACVTYHALFSSTAHDVMQVFLWLYHVMYVHYLPYQTLA
jgi:hypothetical protein